MKTIFKLCICCFAFTLLFAACSKEDPQTPEKAVLDAAQQETVSAATSASLMDEELEKLSKYRGIADPSVLTGFYNLDSEEETSALSRSMAQGFPKTGKYQYFYMENNALMLVSVALKDGLYYELMYNTVDGSSTVSTYTTLRAEETEELGTDNIKRRQTKFFLENDEVSKYVGKDIRNLTESEVVDAFKQYKGMVDKSAYAAWKAPNEILEQSYSEQYGLMSDFKYTAWVEGILYVCGVNLASDGYCLTVYDPAKDWFEVQIFSKLYCVLTDDGTKEYYLSNQEQNFEYKKNTIADMKNDGYLFITNEIK